MSDASNFHAPPELWHKLKPLARQLRTDQTLLEIRLWEHIRKRKVHGAKFRRQFVIERFNVDFICLEHHLIIEVDGSIHEEQQEYDAIRQEFLEAIGYRVLRFTNEQVNHSIEAVLSQISKALS